MKQILWGKTIAAVQMILSRQQDFNNLRFPASKSQQQPFRLIGKVLKASLSFNYGINFINTFGPE